MAAEDNMMTLVEFLAKARPGPLEEEVVSAESLFEGVFAPSIPSCHQTPFEGSIVVFVNEVEVEDGRG